MASSKARQGGAAPPRSESLLRAAAQAILRIGSDHPRVALAHAYTVAHGDSDQRTGSLIALSAMNRISADAVAVLVEALDGDAEGLRETITALGMIGPAAKDAIPLLDNLAANGDPQIAERAKVALRHVRGR